MPATHSYRVESVETLTVAGRSLETFKIAFAFLNERRHRRTDYYLWYAPDVRQYVKQEGGPGPAWTVVAFDRQGPAPLTIALAGPADDERASTPDLTVRGKITGEAR